MARERGRLIAGALLLAGFIVILVGMFLPLLGGQNALRHMDAMFNSIAKGSADYIPYLVEETADWSETAVEVDLELGSEERASDMSRVLTGRGVPCQQSGSSLAVQGQLGSILGGCLEDSGDMFENLGERLQARHGLEGKRVLHDWWMALKEMDKDLNRQRRFAEAKFVTTVNKKAVECAYNFYGVEARRISEYVLEVVLALLFYVVYTVWYGFAIMYLFEGAGLKL